ncbi:hypothetical protein AVEN_152814-1 [Araneus ventricosus]|uniref:Helitron helicase-like domain-containing protein n=1 Tax=Araneus ventricosus TaxID=182803 RepID=A0A4Y2LID0_ARAVE|nr:hypothetical protein AVEN_152814-1 [Araneus ventricosus]
MFPKEFRTATTMNVSVYPLYCRCPSDTTFVRGREMDNRFVAPYNPYLLLKYNVTSLRAVKYIYKYIYKGFDCANMVLSAGQVQYNEIANYIDARYVNAPEAMWRLLGSHMHDDRMQWGDCLFSSQTRNESRLRTATKRRPWRLQDQDKRC